MKEPEKASLSVEKRWRGKAKGAQLKVLQKCTGRVLHYDPESNADYAVLENSASLKFMVPWF